MGHYLLSFLKFCNYLLLFFKKENILLIRNCIGRKITLNSIEKEVVARWHIAGLREVVEQDGSKVLASINQTKVEFSPWTSLIANQQSDSTSKMVAIYRKITIRTRLAFVELKQISKVNYIVIGGLLFFYQLN